MKKYMSILLLAISTFSFAQTKEAYFQSNKEAFYKYTSAMKDIQKTPPKNYEMACEQYLNCFRYFFLSDEAYSSMATYSSGVLTSPEIEKFINENKNVIGPLAKKVLDNIAAKYPKMLSDSTVTQRFIAEALARTSGMKNTLENMQKIDAQNLPLLEKTHQAYMVYAKYLFAETLVRNFLQNSDHKEEKELQDYIDKNSGDIDAMFEKITSNK